MATRVPDDDALHLMMKYCISFNIQGIITLFIQQETKVLDEKKTEMKDFPYSSQEIQINYRRFFSHKCILSFYTYI